MSNRDGAYLYQIGPRFFAIHNHDRLQGGQLTNCPDFIGNGIWISEEVIRDAFHELLQIFISPRCGVLAPSGNVATLISNTSEPAPSEIVQCANKGVDDSTEQLCQFNGGMIGVVIALFLFTVASWSMIVYAKKLHTVVIDPPERIDHNREEVDVPARSLDV